ncbi:hypothetical protein [Exiguobacterium artemiae]|uniref:hypothetical protein n=1 Tax=Exiguobacterium artemiae TaxID=340145 RepID=UPI001F2251F1|nr:hypothetical protein [Exiguobacterium sibiricum]
MNKSLSLNEVKSGAFSFEDAVDLSGSNKAFKGSLIGMAVGILGGPFGILLGSMTGMLIGGSKDLKRESSCSRNI